MHYPRRTVHRLCRCSHQPRLWWRQGLHEQRPRQDAIWGVWTPPWFIYAPDWGAISGGPGKFSIRGGFGIYYDRTEEETALQTLETPPFGTSTTGAGLIGAASFANPFADLNATGSVANPFPIPSRRRAPMSISALEPIFDISTYGPDFRAPMRRTSSSASNVSSRPASWHV